jgi:WhiB family redox-sensing transcriptional regulator
LQVVTVDRHQVISYGTGKKGSLKSMDLYLGSAPFNGSQLCKSEDPELFFPEDYNHRLSVNKAKAVCQSCPLTTACLEYAMSDSSLDGVWGGTTPQDRKNLRRRKRALL